MSDPSSSPGAPPGAPTDVFNRTLFRVRLVNLPVKVTKGILSSALRDVLLKALKVNVDSLHSVKCPSAKGFAVLTFTDLESKDAFYKAFVDRFEGNKISMDRLIKDGELVKGTEAKDTKLIDGAIKHAGGTNGGKNNPAPTKANHHNNKRPMYDPSKPITAEEIMDKLTPSYKVGEHSSENRHSNTQNT